MEGERTMERKTRVNPFSLLDGEGRDVVVFLFASPMKVYLDLAFLSILIGFVMRFLQFFREKTRLYL